MRSCFVLFHVALLGIATETERMASFRGRQLFLTGTDFQGKDST